MGDQNSKKGLRIAPGSTRYKLAQLVLKLIYKRDWHYISPWTHYSLSGGVIMIHGDKMMLATRRGVEQAGLLWYAGGHLDSGDKSVAEGAAREVFEECSIKIDHTRLTEETTINIKLKQKQQYFEQADVDHLAFDYVYILSDGEASQLKDSTEMVGWTFYTEDEVVKLAEEGRLASYEALPVIKKAFKYAREHSDR